MPQFLKTKGVTSQIDDIISNASESIYIISPYISFIPNTTVARLHEALERNVKVTLIYRYKDKIHLNEVAKLELLKGMKIHYNENLHGKAYCNEQEAVVTSFNLSGASEVNNFEFGVYFTREESPAMYNGLISEIKVILQTGVRSSIQKEDSIETLVSESKSGGFCIRCKTGILCNQEKPFCYSCFLTWNEFKKVHYKEKFCHICGNDAATSMAQPICEKHA